MMDRELLLKLIRESEKSADIYKETPYWARYRDELLATVNKGMNLNEIRSGKYRRFASFGFNEFFPQRSFYKKSKDMVKLAVKYLFSNQPYFPTYLSPYSLSLQDVRELAYHHCELESKLTNSKKISAIEASSFGSPQDLFRIDGRLYTMIFLSFYIRYCFANSVMQLKGDEVLVELGSGSGHQIEILKKLYPNLTILCFDLPVPLFLSEKYLSSIFGSDKIVSSYETINWDNLSNIEKGKIHYIGNWKFLLLQNFKFDIFWNAASFGEMEPHVVKSYLATILGNCNWIYLLQSRKGKQSTNIKIQFEDYTEWIVNYTMIKEDDVFRAHKKLRDSSDYFQAVWGKN